jgi:hypothetical protein
VVNVYERTFGRRLDDLASVRQKAALDVALRAPEEAWIANGFPLDAKALAAIVDAAVGGTQRLRL